MRRGGQDRRDRTQRSGCSPFSILFGQRSVDRCHALPFLRAGGHALTKHAHREEATAGRRARSDQPGCDTEEYATAHKPRLARGILSACKGVLTKFIYEKFI